MILSLVGNCSLLRSCSKGSRSVKHIKKIIEKFSQVTICSLQFLPVVRMPGELSDQEEEVEEEVMTTMMTKMMSPARNTHTSPD